MTAAIIANLEKLLDGPRDGAMLRYSLGNELLKAGDAAGAARRFREAVEKDPRYSAAWKLLGKSLVEAGEHTAALIAYTQGIEVAEARGDVQAAKEMSVFARRLQKAEAATSPDQNAAG
jgi:Flp pilus assembly protein TadD